MRVAPAAFVVADPDSGFALGCELARYTHGHPSGYLAAGALVALLRRLIDGETVDIALPPVLDRLATQSAAAEVRTALDQALALAASGVAPTAESVERLGGGWVAEEALAIAVYCALVAPDLEQALILAVNPSHSHPLRIVGVTIPDGHGRIGLTLCPGKHQPGGLSGHWQRDLDTDLQAIVDWGACAVITLMESQELERFRVADLPDRVRAFGLEGYHLPIVDAGVPDAGFERRWAELGPVIRARLRQGESILIHCLGGLGRTGLLAARLLVEHGLNPEQAIRTVRAVRPHAIETAAQEAHVRRCRPIERRSA